MKCHFKSGVSELKLKHRHARDEPSPREGSQNRACSRHYPQCCLQLVFERADLLLQVLDFRLFDPQQDLEGQKRRDHTPADTTEPPDSHPLHLGATEPGHKAQNREKGGLGSQDLPVPLRPQCTVAAVWKDRGSWWPTGSHPCSQAHLQLVGVLALGERRASSLSSTLPGQQGPQPRDLRSQAVIQLLEDGGRCYRMGEQGQGSVQSQQHLPALLGASSVAFWSCKRASFTKTPAFSLKREMRTPAWGSKVVTMPSRDIESLRLEKSSKIVPSNP